MSPDPVVRLRSLNNEADAALPPRSQGRRHRRQPRQLAAQRRHDRCIPTGWRRARVNLSAVERRAATLTTRRTVKKEWQAAWLVKAITCIDLTTLAGDDTPARVRAPLRQGDAIRSARDLVEALGLDHMPTVGAVCVYPTMVATAVKALAGSGIPGRFRRDRLSRRA